MTKDHVSRPLLGMAIGVACCAFASIGVADASTITISGTLDSIPGGIGTSSGQNNVENNTTNLPSGYSGFSGPSNGSGWYFGGSVTANVPTYTATWYFLGSESGYQNTLTISAPAFSTPELNQNNNCSNCGSIGSGAGTYFSPTPFATTVSSLSLIPLTLTTNQSTPYVDSNGNNPTSIIYSYVTPIYVGNILSGWTMSSSATDWFAFGWNDDGRPGHIDGDYDDFMGVAHVVGPDFNIPQGAPGPVFGAGLPGVLAGFGVLLAWYRKRRIALST